MLTDRDMAIDCLESTKHSIVDLTKSYMECSNPSLKNSILQMRNRCEQTQQEIATISQNKGWYMPSPPASHPDIQKVQSFFNQQMQQMPNQPMFQRHMENPHDPMRYQ